MHRRVLSLRPPSLKHHDISDRTTSWTLCRPSNAVGCPTANPKAFAPYHCHKRCRCGLVLSNSSDWPPRSATMMTMTTTTMRRQRRRQWRNDNDDGDSATGDRIRRRWRWRQRDGRRDTTTMATTMVTTMATTMVTDDDNNDVDGDGDTTT